MIVYTQPTQARRLLEKGNFEPHKIQYACDIAHKERTQLLQYFLNKKDV